MITFFDLLWFVLIPLNFKKTILHRIIFPTRVDISIFQSDLTHLFPVSHIPPFAHHVLLLIPGLDFSPSHPFLPTITPPDSPFHSPPYFPLSYGHLHPFILPNSLLAHAINYPVPHTNVPLNHTLTWGLQSMPSSYRLFLPSLPSIWIMA